MIQMKPCVLKITLEWFLKNTTKDITENVRICLNKPLYRKQYIIKPYNNSSMVYISQICLYVKKEDFYEVPDVKH